MKALLALLLATVSLWSAEPGNVRSEFAERFFREKVEPVFVEHCNECHANGRRKGGLSMASLEDLLEGANEGGVLVPGDVVKSTLVTAIRWEAHDAELNMPPDKKLPEQAIADLTRWVGMGAPWPVGPASASAPAPVARSLPPLAGRLHPLVVHFPIACLLLAVLAEALFAFRGERWRPATALLVLIGLAGAIAAVISGSLLAQEETAAIERHELLGWVTCVSAAVCAVLLRPANRWPLRIALLLTALLAGLTGHLGGELVYGTGWFRF